MENKISKELKVEQEGEKFFSTLTKTYDYAPKYKTTTVQRMEVMSRDWCEENLETLKEENTKASLKIADNDKFLADMNPTDFEEETFKEFIDNFEDKYKPMLELKEKLDDYRAKQSANEQFKLELKEQQKFIEHYEEMLSKWVVYSEE